MSIDGDDIFSEPKRKGKPKKSVDAEFHDSLDHDFLASLEGLGVSNSSSRKATSNPFDDYCSEGDDGCSFGEASDSCVADHDFLEEILQEYHPERLNLLESEVPELIYNKNATNQIISPMNKLTRTTKKQQLVTDDSSSSSTTSDESSKISHSETLASQFDDNSTRSQSKTAATDYSERSENIDCDEAENSTLTSPKNRSQLIGPGALARAKLMGSMGDSTKKSLRTINNKDFWSKPFKGTPEGLRQSGDVQEVADS